MIRSYVSAPLALVLGTCGLAACANSTAAPPKPVGSTVHVSVTADGCVPDPTTAPAGPITFAATNNGAAAVDELELVQGGKVLAEIENLPPGSAGEIALDATAGEYELFCPGADTSRTPFTVTDATGQVSSTCSPQVQQALDDAVAGYKTYVNTEVDELMAQTKEFTEAVRAGNVPAAKAAFASARYHWETIEPVAESFGDLDPLVDARVNDVEEGAEFTGFHRIEKALWVQNTTKGMAKYADQLEANLQQLKNLVADENYQPAQLANGAGELLGEVGKSKITGEEDRYSHTDMSDIDANVEGSQKAWALLQPAVMQLNPELAQTIDARFATLDATIAKYKNADGSYVSYDKVTQAQRRELAQQVDAVAEPLSQIATLVASC